METRSCLVFLYWWLMRKTKHGALQGIASILCTQEKEREKMLYIRSFARRSTKVTEKISFFWESEEGKTKPKWKITKDNGNEEHELELSPNMLRFFGVKKRKWKQTAPHACTPLVGWIRARFNALWRRKKDSWCCLFFDTEHDTKRAQARNVLKGSEWE